MNFSSNFTIYIRINTSYGLKYLYYTPVTYNLGRQSQNRYIHHGLGLDAKNGSWRTFSRDLEADLQEFEPGNKILAVLGFLVRGGGKIDDIQLLSQNEHNQNIFEDPVSNIPPPSKCR